MWETKTTIPANSFFRTNKQKITAQNIAIGDRFYIDNTKFTGTNPKSIMQVMDKMPPSAPFDKNTCIGMFLTMISPKDKRNLRIKLYWSFEYIYYKNAPIETIPPRGNLICPKVFHQFWKEQKDNNY